nr:hypothetical protein [uncultured Glaciecola sp.]
MALAVFEAFFAAIIGYAFWDKPLTLAMFFDAILLILAANVTFRQR